MFTPFAFIKNIVAASVVFDTDAQAFITAAGITNPTQQNAINTLVVGMKADNIWTKMNAIYPFVGGTATTHKWNLKDPRDLDAAYRLQFFGGWTHNSNGIQGDGSSGYANTFAATNTTAIPNLANHWSSYLKQLNTNPYGGYEGVYDYPGNFKFFGFFNRNDGSGFYLGLQNNQGGGGVSTPSFLTGTVTSGTTGVLYKNGISVATISNPGSFINSFNYLLGAQYVISPDLYNDNVTAFTSLGNALTSTDAANLYTRVQAFQTTLGRQI
jgi:hypothetical protein